MSANPEKVLCLIIGSGPAGYTAAIYAARANLSPVLYTGKEPGGQLMITTDVENYPGYPEGVMGPQMMDEFRAQAERFDTDIRYELIEKVEFNGNVHKVWTESGHEILAESVVIATGASAKWLGIESEKTIDQQRSFCLRGVRWVLFPRKRGSCCGRRGYCRRRGTVPGQTLSESPHADQTG